MDREGRRKGLPISRAANSRSRDRMFCSGQGEIAAPGDKYRRSGIARVFTLYGRNGAVKDGGNRLLRTPSRIAH